MSSIFKNISIIEFLHPLSAIIVIALDQIWTLIEVPVGAVFPPAIIITSIIIFLISFIAVSLVELIIAKTSISAALTKGFVMGVSAAVPLPVFSMALGGISLIGTAAKYISKS